MYANITLQIFRIAFEFDLSFCGSEYFQAKHYSMEPRFDFRIIDKNKIREERIKFIIDFGRY